LSLFRQGAAQAATLTAQAGLPSDLKGGADAYAGAPAIHLTAREQEVLTMMAKGLKAAEIGRVLGISVNTVNGYVREIYRKLDISSRAEAALEATRRGLVH
jgi:DNA-binding NarL/FixJ family response regulator